MFDDDIWSHGVDINNTDDAVDYETVFTLILCRWQSYYYSSWMLICRDDACYWFDIMRHSSVGGRVTDP